MLKLKAIRIPEEPYSYNLATWGDVWWVNPHPDPAISQGKPGTWLLNFLTHAKYGRHIFNVKLSSEKSVRPKLLFKISRWLIFLVA